MILKKLKRTNFSRTKAAMIGGLVDYVLAQNDEQGFEKRQYAYGFNFVAKTIRAWTQDMLREKYADVRMGLADWMQGQPCIYAVSDILRTKWTGN